MGGRGVHVILFFFFFFLLKRKETNKNSHVTQKVGDSVLVHFCSARLSVFWGVGVFFTQSLEKVNMNEVVSVSVYVSVPREAIPRKLLKSSSSNLARWLPQTASSVPCIDLDLCSRSYRSENKKFVFDYFKKVPSNAHQVYCEGSLTSGLYNRCQSNDLDLHSRSQLRLKFDTLLICSLIVITSTIKTWHDGRLMHSICSFRLPWPHHGDLAGGAGGAFNYLDN